MGRDLGEQVRIEVPTDHSRCLCNLACGAEPVEPAHQGGLKRRRHGIFGLAQLQDRPGQLLGEQRNALGALDDARDHRRGQGQFRRLPGDNPLELDATEPRERERRDVGGCTRSEGEFEPARGDHHQRQRFAEPDEPPEPFLRRRIGPVHVFEDDQERPPLRCPAKETVE